MKETHRQHDFFGGSLKLISSFLRRGESCFLPGIGVLATEFQPATEEEGQVSPPKRKIVIKTNASDAQHAIIEELITYFKFSAEEAESAWLQMQESIKSRLREGKPLIFPGIGALKQMADQSLQFEGYSEKSFYAPVSLSQDDIEEMGNVDAVGIEKKKSRRKRTTVFISLILLILVLLLLFVYLFFINRFWEPMKNDFSTAPVPADTSLSSQAPAVSPVDTATILQEPSDNAPDSIHFAVIFKTFNSQRPAERYYRKMVGWGHEVKAYTLDSTDFLIGYPFFALPADTTMEKEKLQKTYRAETFVIYPQRERYTVIQ